MHCPPTGLSWAGVKGAVQGCQNDGCPQCSSPSHSQPSGSQAFCPKFFYCYQLSASLFPMLSQVSSSTPQTAPKAPITTQVSPSTPQTAPKPPLLSPGHSCAHPYSSADLLHPGSLPALSHHTLPPPPAPAPVASSCSPTSKASLSVMEREVVRQLRY